jgi:hypothetical protein
MLDLVVGCRTRSLNVEQPLRHNRPTLAIRGLRYVIAGLCYAIRGLRYAISDLRYAITGLRYVIAGLCYVTTGLLCVIAGLRYVISCSNSTLLLLARCTLHS